LGQRACPFAGEDTDADVDVDADADAETVLFVGVLVGRFTIGVGSGRACRIIESRFVSVRVGVG